MSIFFFKLNSKLTKPKIHEKVLRTDFCIKVRALKIIKQSYFFRKVVANKLKLHFCHM